MPVTAADCERQKSTTLSDTDAMTLAGLQSASAVSCVNTVAVCSMTAAGPRQYSGVSQSVQSDNSFDAEFCDVEPDSSPGSVVNNDDVELSAGATLVSEAVSGRGNDTLGSSSHSVDARSPTTHVQATVTVETSRATTATSDAAVYTSLPVYSSMTRTDLLPKSSFPLPCAQFPSPVKHNADIFNPVLLPPLSDSLRDYVAPVMLAESSTRCIRFLPATAAALCDTSTVSSPSFARSLCASISSAARRPQFEPSLTAISESDTVDRQVCSMSVPNLASGLAQHNTVVTSSTPVMADVLQAQLDQGSLHQLSAAGLPVMRTARITDHADLLNALLSQTQLGIPKTEALVGSTGRQQVLPNDLTVPVIAFLNLGAGAGSLPSLSCAAVLPPGALQFLKISVSNESVSCSTVSSADQGRPPV